MSDADAKPARKKRSRRAAAKKVPRDVPTIPGETGELEPPEGFKPTPKMNRLLEVFLTAGSQYPTQRDLCEAAGVDPSTVRRWWRKVDFPVWWNAEVYRALKNQRGEVWRVLTDKALKGEASAITLWLKRFDLAERPIEDVSHTDIQRILADYGIRYNDAGQDADRPEGEPQV